MTVAEVHELFAYNAWANRRIFTALGPLAGEQYFRDLKSSHGGIHGTLCHIVWAEQLWLNRWMGEPFLSGFTELRLEDTVIVRPSTGGEFRHTFREMFGHAIDHSSYHRGQIVTMVRQVGATPPNTGLIVFYRERGGPSMATD